MPHASRCTGSSYCSTGVASNRVRFAGSVSCFTSVVIDRVDLRVVRSCQRSIGSVSTASKRRHMAWCCVCMRVNETGHAQRLNMLKQRPRKWFFRKEVDFLSSLAFVVNLVRSYDRPPASPSGALFISNVYGVRPYAFHSYQNVCCVSFFFKCSSLK